MSFFSAPKALTMPAVGFDISVDTVRFIELEEKNGKITVSRFASQTFPLGVIAQGRINDREKLREVIKLLAKEYNLSFANVALPEEQAYLVNMEIPTISPKEMHDVIELKLEEYVPIKASDATFDYVTVGDHHRDGSKVVVSVLPSTTVEEYLSVFEGTGLTPKSFEFESQAMSRAIVPKENSGTFLVLDVGKLVTDIFVTAHGVVQFSASLDFGGDHISTAIEKALKVSHEEAEALKVAHGLIGTAEHPTLRPAVLAAVGDLRARLMRHYSYWQTHHSDKTGGNIEGVFITGGGANLNGLTEYLSMGLDVKVWVANPWANVASFEEYIPPIHARASQGYAAAIGLALRDFNT